MINQLLVEIVVTFINFIIAIFVGYISINLQGFSKQARQLFDNLTGIREKVQAMEKSVKRMAKSEHAALKELRIAIEEAKQIEKNLLTFDEIVEKSLAQTEEAFNMFFVKSLEFDATLGTTLKSFDEAFTHHEHLFKKIASLPNADDILKLAAVLDVHLAIAQMRLGLDQSPDSTMTQLLLITQQVAELKGQDNVRLAKNASAFHSALLKMRDDKKLRDLVNKALLQTVEVT